MQRQLFCNSTILFIFIYLLQNLRFMHTLRHSL